MYEDDKSEKTLFFYADSENDFESYTIQRQIKFAAELPLGV